MSRALKLDNLYLGTGPGWTLCKSMHTAIQGAFVFRFGPSGPYFADGLITLNIQMHISWEAEK